MGSDKGDKEKAKLEKKRLKAQVKSEKARIKAGQVTEMPEKAQVTPSQEHTVRVAEPPRKPPPWYKDPNWIRAIVAIVTLLVLVISLFLTVFWD